MNWESLRCEEISGRSLGEEEDHISSDDFAEPESQEEELDPVEELLKRNRS